MTKQTKQAGAVTQNKAGLKVISPIQQIEIIEGAVQAVLDNFSNVEVAKNAVGKIEGGQLGILADALKDYPEPMTEEVWNKMFKANVSDVLSKARINGSRRYANPSSRDVMVNLFKVATMGLTLAKHDRAFAPTFSTATNLKKYAVAVRPMLQTANHLHAAYNTAMNELHRRGDIDDEILSARKSELREIIKGMG